MLRDKNFFKTDFLQQDSADYAEVSAGFSAKITKNSKRVISQPDNASFYLREELKRKAFGEFIISQPVYSRLTMDTCTLTCTPLLPWAPGENRKFNPNQNGLFEKRPRKL